MHQLILSVCVWSFGCAIITSLWSPSLVSIDSGHGMKSELLNC